MIRCIVVDRDVGLVVNETDRDDRCSFSHHRHQDKHIICDENLCLTRVISIYLKKNQLYSILSTL